MLKIHPTAIVSPKAELDDDVVIGPYCIVGEKVKIGKATALKSHVVVEGNTEIGLGCIIYQFASLGTPPQDFKYKGTDTLLKIGNNNIIREYVTMNPGTEHGGGVTLIGDNNFFMIGCHVAHDSIIGNNVIMANAVSLGGHVIIEDHAIVGGLSAIHQFVRIGAYAMIGGLSGVSQDIPPYTIAAGNRAKLYGINIVGLRRHKFPEETINQIKKAFKIIFREKLLLEEALQKVEREIPYVPEVRHMVEFIRKSKRGVVR